MRDRKFLDFDVRFERANKEYIVRVLNSPGGQASIIFDLPFSDTEIENILPKFGRSQNRARKIDSSEMKLKFLAISRYVSTSLIDPLAI